MPKPKRNKRALSVSFASTPPEVANKRTKATGKPATAPVFKDEDKDPKNTPEALKKLGRKKPRQTRGSIATTDTDTDTDTYANAMGKPLKKRNNKSMKRNDTFTDTDFDSDVISKRKSRKPSKKMAYTTSETDADADADGDSDGNSLMNIKEYHVSDII
jgi:beta-galactosidase GanA